MAGQLADDVREIVTQMQESRDRFARWGKGTADQDTAKAIVLDRYITRLCEALGEAPAPWSFTDYAESD